MKEIENTIKKYIKRLFFAVLCLVLSFLSTYLCINWDFADEYSGGIGWMIGVLISYSIFQYYRDKMFKIEHILYPFLFTWMLLAFATGELWSDSAAKYIIINILLCWGILFCDE